MPPHGDGVLPLPAGIPSSGTVRLRLIYRSKTADGLLPAGWERGFDQLTVREERRPLPSPLPSPLPGGIRMEESPRDIRLKGDGFSYVFSKRTGLPLQLEKGGLPLFARPVEWNLWRAPLDNDRYVRDSWETAGFSRPIPRVSAYEVGEEKAAPFCAFGYL